MYLEEKQQCDPVNETLFIGPKLPEESIDVSPSFPEVPEREDLKQDEQGIQNFLYSYCTYLLRITSSVLQYVFQGNIRALWRIELVVIGDFHLLKVLDFYIEFCHSSTIFKFSFINIVK